MSSQRQLGKRVMLPITLLSLGLRRKRQGTRAERHKEASNLSNLRRPRGESLKKFNTKIKDFKVGSLRVKQKWEKAEGGQILRCWSFSLHPGEFRKFESSVFGSFSSFEENRGPQGSSGFTYWWATRSLVHNVLVFCLCIFFPFKKSFLHLVTGIVKGDLRSEVVPLFGAKRKQVVEIMLPSCWGPGWLEPGLTSNHLQTPISTLS